MKNIRLEIGEPTVVYQNQIEAGNKWGYYQFPCADFTKSGDIALTFNTTPDNVHDKQDSNSTQTVISEDGGKTWRLKTPNDHLISNARMPNGCYFRGFDVVTSVVADYIEKYQPVAKGMYNTNIYFKKDIKELNEVYTCREFDPSTNTLHTFHADVKMWDHAAVGVWSGNRLLPGAYAFAMANASGIMMLDDTLFLCTYLQGIDYFADSREEALCVLKNGRAYYSACVFRSTDCGRSWELYSQILSDDDIILSDTPHLEGLCEPMMAKMPDGSVVMLIRSGGNFNALFPSYLSRSTDGCKTWSKPQKFDSIGVFPQIVALDCGVSLASYGRPGLFLRATSDPAGLEWEAPIEIPLSDGEEQRSCYYTQLLPIDAHTALFFYSDFHHPLPEGSGEGKAILMRKITVY